MKTYLLTIVLLMAGCSNYVTKPEADAVYKQIGTILQQNAGYTNLLVNRVFEKDIKRCKDKGLGLDLQKLECVADKKEEAKK